MQTLFQHIGGEETIKKLITPFYQKVFTDSILGPFFVNTSLEKLTRMQEQFFTIALGGPEPDTEISLFQAHQGRGIQQEHLTRFTEHLLDTLREVGVDDNDASAVVAETTLWRVTPTNRAASRWLASALAIAIESL